MRKCTPKNIWNFAQNKPTLIVKDLVAIYPQIDPNIVYEILLRRGVFKWLAVRRDIIKYKNELKIEITRLNRKKSQKEKGYHKALIECMLRIRKLCHSDRFRAPDFDKKANTYISPQ
jgi:hypothetical protein